jgi:hypothetical protein
MRHLTRSRTAATGLLAGSARETGRSRLSLRRRKGTPPRWPTVSARISMREAEYPLTLLSTLPAIAAELSHHHGRKSDRRLRAASDRAQRTCGCADRLVLHAFECRRRAAPAGPQMTRPGGVLAACMGTLPVARNCALPVGKRHPGRLVHGQACLRGWRAKLMAGEHPTCAAGQDLHSQGRRSPDGSRQPS